MSGAIPEVRWLCTNCGTENAATFGGQGFVCAACGSDEVLEGRNYATIVEANKATFPALFWDKPFGDAQATLEMRNWVIGVCPQFTSKSLWRDCTLFDFCWLLSASLDVAWSVPLERLPEKAWEMLSPFQSHPAFAIKHFLAAHSVDWLRKALAAKTLGDIELRHAVALFLAQPWAETDSSARVAFVDFLVELPDATLKSLVPALPVDMKLMIWLHRPEGIVAADEVLSQVDGATATAYLADERYAKAIALHYDFTRFSVSDWRTALSTVRASAISDRFRAALAEQWAVLRFSHEVVLDIIVHNPIAERFLPFEHFAPECFLFLFTHLDDIAWDVTAHCNFRIFQPRHWVAVLSDERILKSATVKQAIDTCNVIAKLTPTQCVHILETNPKALAFFAVADLPLEDAVAFYLKYPDFSFKDETGFQECPKDLATSLLAKCDNRIPSCAVQMLEEGSKQAFTNGEIEGLLSQNPRLAAFVPKERLVTLSAEIFIGLLVLQKELGTWDVVAHCPFEKFGKAHWESLLFDSRIQLTSTLKKIITDKRVPALFNRSERVAIVESNPASFVFFDVADLPLAKAVELYISHPEVPFADDSLFLDCEPSLAVRLLARCGERVPSVALDMLRKGSNNAFTAEDIAMLLDANPALARHLPDERIAALPPSLFLALAEQVKGADYWVAHYDLVRLPRAQQITLVQLAPWALGRMNAEEWTSRDLKAVRWALPWARLSTWRKIRFFIYDNICF